jgi:hypothetical protein
MLFLFEIVVTIAFLKGGKCQDCSIEHANEDEKEKVAKVAVIEIANRIEHPACKKKRDVGSVNQVVHDGR